MHILTFKTLELLWKQILSWYHQFIPTYTVFITQQITLIVVEDALQRAYVHHTWRKQEHKNKLLSKKMDRWIMFHLWGQPFDPEGGGANLVWTDYLFSSFARPENLNKQKKKRSREHRTWLSVLHDFCRVLAHNVVYLVAGMFRYWFISVFLCIELYLKGGGGLGVLPQNFFKQYSYKMVPFLCNNDGYTY